MGNYKRLAVNPGSTSTKVAVFKGTEKLLSENVSHATEDLAKFAEVSDQLQFRYQMIRDMLKEKNIDLSDLDAAVGRGGGLMACEGGVYARGDSIRGAHPHDRGARLRR